MAVKNLLGIDIGSSSIKLVELDRGKEKFLLRAIGEIAIPSGLLASESEESFSTLSFYLKKLIQDSGCHTNNAVSTIPSEKVFLSTIEFPPMPKEELDYAMRWEIKRQIPDYEDRVISWEVLNQDKGLEIFLAAAPRMFVSKQLDILKMSGLNPISLETEPVALSRSLVDAGKEGVVVVHIGVSFSFCMLVEKGSLKIVRNLKTGENEMIRALVGREGDYLETKKMLYKNGFSKSKENEKNYNTLKPVLKGLISEIQRLLGFYQERTQKEISQIIVSGGCAGIPGITDYLSETLFLEARIANPWFKLDHSLIRDSKKLTRLGSRFAVAVGLAMM